MTINQLKTAVYGHFKAYWDGAVVVWGATDKVQPQSPLVTLRLGIVTREVQPIQQNINGILFSAYPSKVSLQVDLFTRGKAVNIGSEVYYENTAANDLLDFVNFLDSPSTIGWSNTKDISIALMSGVHDVSEVINDSQWQYRAMSELRLSFTQWAAEYKGILSEASIVFGANGLPVDVIPDKWQQTASGGGTKELASETTGFFYEVLKVEQEEIANG